MNDDRKFQQNAEQAKILFENDIPNEIVAAILNISVSTVSAYRKKVEKKYQISLTSGGSKVKAYPRLLKLYANLFSQKRKFFKYGQNRPDENNLVSANNALLKAAGMFINITAIETAIENALTFTRALKAPSVKSEPSPRLKGGARLLSYVLHIEINPFYYYIPGREDEKQEMICEVMRAIIENRIKTDEIESAAGFIDQVMSFIANQINREELTTLTLDETKVMAAINSVFETLTERESDVIKLYYGLDGKQPLTLDAIGEKFDLSRERVRQIKEKAIRRMKHSSRARILLTTISSQALLEDLQKKLADKENC